MPEIEITVGGRSYAVFCQDGQEPYLRAAVALLDAEAKAIREGGERLPEGRMLLMAGILLADKMAGLEDRARVAEERAAEAEGRAAALETEVAQMVSATPERVEVPVIPRNVLDALAEFVAKSEAVAADLERRSADAEDRR